MPKSSETAQKSAEPKLKQSKKPRLSLPKLTKKTMGITLWIVLLVIVGVISFTASRNNALAANRTAEKALTALKNNDDTTIYNLGSDDFKKSSDKQKVKDVVNQWSKVIVQATDGKPELVSKRETQKDNKRLTTLEYKYKIKPGKVR